MKRLRRSDLAFTLTEILVVIGIVALLAALSVPLLHAVRERARASGCIGNLRQIGGALHLYLADNHSVFPTLLTAREQRTDPGPVIDEVLLEYASGVEDVFGCPADTLGRYQSSGTSYVWNHLLNGQHAARLQFLGTSGATRIPVLADKENFHPGHDSEVNILHADGHVAKELTFDVGP